MTHLKISLKLKMRSFNVTEINLKCSFQRIKLYIAEQIIKQAFSSLHLIKFKIFPTHLLSKLPMQSYIIEIK